LYKRRVENTPKREQELMSLQRDYTNIQESYSSLLNRRLEAEISVNMERKQKGEQFRILDPARLPEKPVEPDMQKLLLLFIGAGMGIGGGIVFLLEYFDKSFRRPEDIERVLDLPILSTVPPVLQTGDRVWRLTNRVLSVICFVFVLALLGFFVSLTMRGVDQTLALVQKFI
jgi:capsular polysaccharide biosynthesis protein